MSMNATAGTAFMATVSVGMVMFTGNTETITALILPVYIQQKTER